MREGLSKYDVVIAPSLILILEIDFRGVGLPPLPRPRAVQARNGPLNAGQVIAAR